MAETGPTLEVQRIAMSWEEFSRRPDSAREEWVDGAALLTPPASLDHGDVVVRLGAALRPTLRPLRTVTEVGLWLPGNRLRAPDLMAVRARPSGRFVTDPPVLCVEVLSRATRSEDTLHKSREYAEGGVEHYWLVDPELRTLEALRLDGGPGGVWIPVASLDDDHPRATLEVDGHAVDVNLSDLLGDLLGEAAEN